MPAAIDYDLLCLNCGYNLRGVDPGGACPECGMAVHTSRREDHLADAPPTWLAGLRRGAAWFGLGTLLTLPLLYLGLGIATLGAWRLTAAEPGRNEPARDQRLRWAARALLGLGTMVLIVLMAGGAAALMIDRQTILAMRWQAVDAAFIAGHALYWMGLLALSAHLEGLAQRIPDDRLLRRLARFRLVWLLGMAAGVALALAAAGADLVYRRLGVHYLWVTPAFAFAVLLILLWLWAETLALARQLNRSLRLPVD